MRATGQMTAKKLLRNTADDDGTQNILHNIASQKMSPPYLSTIISGIDFNSTLQQQCNNLVGQTWLDSELVILGTIDFFPIIHNISSISLLPQECAQWLFQAMAVSIGSAYMWIRAWAAHVATTLDIWKLADWCHRYVKLNEDLRKCTYVLAFSSAIRVFFQLVWEMHVNAILSFQV